MLVSSAHVHVNRRICFGFGVALGWLQLLVDGGSLIQALESF